MMKLLISSVILAAVGASDVLRYQMVNQVNSDPTSTWVARVHDRFKGTSFEKTASLCGSLPEPSGLTTVYHHALSDDALDAIPTSFDAREQWPQCASIREVRDQSDCGSCWAFGAAEAATDRICIASNGKFTPHLSAQTLNSCCTSCGSGCNGGYPSSAWSYLAKTGIPTGGNFGDYSGCQAYSMAPCDHHVTGKYGPCPSTSYKTPTCSKTCDSKSTSPLKFADDVSKNVFSSSYSISSSVSQIQAEILANGPVEASFTVYADFETYSSGVYQHKTGSNLGGHAVKLIGWGVENNTPYWLLANSWNEGWGDKGFFKILRGSNHCGIESSIVAGKFTYKA